MDVRRVMIVEDSPMLAERLRELLGQRPDLSVEAIVDTESAAVKAVEGKHFDVLIVDVELREGSGISVVRRIRELTHGRNRPWIIVLTNYAFPAVRARCLAAGADHFLDKMKDFPRLLGLIADAHTLQ